MEPLFVWTALTKIKSFQCTDGVPPLLTRQREGLHVDPCTGARFARSRAGSERANPNAHLLQLRIPKPTGRRVPNPMRLRTLNPKILKP